MIRIREKRVCVVRGEELEESALNRFCSLGDGDDNDLDFYF